MRTARVAAVSILLATPAARAHGALPASDVVARVDAVCAGVSRFQTTFTFSAMQLLVGPRTPTPVFASALFYVDAAKNRFDLTNPVFAVNGATTSSSNQVTPP